MKELDFPLEIVEDSGLVDNLLKFFDASRLGELARSTKFVQRSTSHLNGLAFLSLHVFEKESLLDSSLNDACAYLSDKFDIKLSKQSLDERYNTYAVGFMKNCFSSLLKEVLVKHGLAGVLGSIFKREGLPIPAGSNCPGTCRPFTRGQVATRVAPLSSCTTSTTWSAVTLSIYAWVPGYKTTRSSSLAAPPWSLATS